jgi:hypothetical protein
MDRRVSEFLWFLAKRRECGSNHTLVSLQETRHATSMKVSGYREGMELEGTNGAIANPMEFDYNQWQSTTNNNLFYQSSPGDYSKYQDNLPVDSYWVSVPAGSSNNGGTWETCITGAGC